MTYQISSNGNVYNITSPQLENYCRDLDSQLASLDSANAGLLDKLKTTRQHYLQQTGKRETPLPPHSAKTKLPPAPYVYVGLKSGHDDVLMVADDCGQEICHGNVVGVGNTILHVGTVADVIQGKLKGIETLKRSNQDLSDEIAFLAGQSNGPANAVQG